MPTRSDPVVATIEAARLAEAGPAGEAARAELLAALRAAGSARLSLAASTGLAGAVDLAYDDLLAFFSGPRRRKAPAHGLPAAFQRGWTPSSRDVAVAAGGDGAAAAKEAFHAGFFPLGSDDRQSFPDLDPPNLWPPDPGALAASLERLGRLLNDAGQLVLESLWTAVGADPAVLDGFVRGGAHLTRAIHYLPWDDPGTPPPLWSAPHQDINLLTVLAPAQAVVGGARRPESATTGGLFTVMGDADPAVVRVDAPAGELVVQAGQQLEVLTGGSVRAPLHLVAPPDDPGTARITVAQLLHARPLSLLAPVAPFERSDAFPRRWTPVAAGTITRRYLEGWRRSAELDG